MTKVRRNKSNKYSNLTTSRHVVRGTDGVLASHILIEVSPDHIYKVDISFLEDRPQMQSAVLEVIRILGDSVTGVTKRNYIRYFKYFVTFLDEYEIKNGVTYRETHDIDGNILINFRIWLETRDIGLTREARPNDKGGAQHTGNEHKFSSMSVDVSYRSVTRLLKTARAHHPELFPRLPSVIPRLGKSNRSWQPVDDVLGASDLARIVAAAQCEIDRTKEQYNRIQRLLKETENLPILPKGEKRTIGYWKSLENTVHSLIRQGDFYSRPQTTLREALRKYHNTSPTEILRMYIPVGESALLPFALQLYILTALNVSSLITLTRDCVEDFPLPQYKKLVYDKPRSGTSRAKSQLFPAVGAKTTEGGTETLFQIIKFLLEWTEPLVREAPQSIKNCLFLYRANRGVARNNIIRSVAKYKPFEASLVAFITRYRDSHQLPNFNLNDLRPAVATYIYFKTRDIFRVQRFLGHRNIITTIRYIRGRIVNAEHDKSMAGAIEEIIRRILPSQSEDAGEDGNTQLPIIVPIIEGKLDNIIDGTTSVENLSPADAAQIKKSGVMTLAARCRQPFKPPSHLNVPPGQICTKIFKCLSCPNAVILEEDLPYVLLRIKQIWEEREMMSEDGWHVVYAEAWLALNQVARLFSEEARNQAAQIMQTQLLLPGEGSNEI